MARSSAELDLLVQAPHAPLERKLDRVLLLRESRETERVDDVGAEHLGLAPAAQLEDAAPAREDAALLIAGDQAGRRRGVIVFHQFEQEAESAVMARDGLVVEALLAVDVDRP